MLGRMGSAGQFVAIRRSWEESAEAGADIVSKVWGYGRYGRVFCEGMCQGVVSYVKEVDCTNKGWLVERDEMGGEDGAKTRKSSSRIFLNLKLKLIR